LTASEVIDEYLYKFESDKQRTIFERSNTTEYNFNDEDGKNPDFDVLNYFCQFTSKNKSYLSIAVMLNFPKVMEAYNWIVDTYQYITSNAYNILRSGYFDTNADKNRVEAIIKMATGWVKKIDVGIVDIEINEDKELFKDDYFNNGKYTWENYVKVLNNVIAWHETKGKNGTFSKIDFKFFRNISNGTLVFFSIALSIAEKILRGGIFIKDELSSEFHTLLSKFVVELFNCEKNASKSQLIFTTHDTNLLDLNLFRRDQIWFTEKNPDTGATDIFSLCDFGDKKDIDVEKGYLLGIYGAIPFIRGSLIDRGGLDG